MYLSIDLGSTQFKAAIFDANLKLRGKSAYTLKYRYTPSGGVELSPKELLLGLKHVITEVLKSSAVKPSLLNAVAIDSQAQTFAMFDKKGTPVSPFFSWLDERAGTTASKMASMPPWDDFAHHSSFGYLLAGLQACMMKHFLCDRIIRKQKNYRFVLLPAWVVELLTGKAVIDNNLAGMSGLFSLIEGKWWNKALENLGIAPEQLPDVIPIGTSAGMTNLQAERFGLPQNIPVILAGNDQTAGAYGAGIEKDNSVLLTLGTAHVVYAVAKSLPNPSRNVIRGVYPGNLFYRMSADSCGGNVTTWGTNLLAGGDYDRFFQLAEKADKKKGIPLFDPEIIKGGSWNDVSISQGPSEFAFSIIDSLARRAAKMINDVDPRGACKEILAAGGGSRRLLFVKLIEEYAGRQIRTTNADPLQGAVRMAVQYVARGRK